MDTRYLGAASQLPPSKLVSLYGDHIFRPEKLPVISRWLDEASDRDRDHFRDAFASITNYYKMRKGPKTDYTANFQNKEPGFVSRRREKEEKEAEYLTRTLNEWTQVARTIKGSDFGARPFTVSGARGESPMPPPSRGGGGGGGGGNQTMGTSGYQTARLAQLAESEAKAGAQVEENSQFAEHILSHYGSILKPAVHETIRTWVNFCSASNRRKLDYCLHAIKRLYTNGGGGGGGGGAGNSTARGAGHRGSGGLGSLALGASMYETTTHSANLLATRGYVPEDGGAADPQSMVSLYGSSVFKEDVWPSVALWLLGASPSDVDKYRDCFSSVTTFHKERKGPRTTFHTAFKVQSRRKREAMDRARETVLQATHRSAGAGGSSQPGSARGPAPTWAPLDLATATERANELSARGLSDRTVSFGRNDHEWETTEAGRTIRDNLSREAAALATTSAHPTAPPKRAVPRFTKPEQESSLGATGRRKHGGFFGRTEYYRSMKWKEREEDEMAQRIKEKNTKGNDPMASMLASGMPESSYRATFKGVQGERPKAVTAEFYE